MGLPLHDVLQIVLSVVLGIVTLVLWGRGVAAAPTPGGGENRRTPEARARLAGAVIVAATAGIALARHIHPGATGIDAVALDAYGALDFAALAVVVGAARDRLRGSAAETPAVLDGV